MMKNNIHTLKLNELYDNRKDFIADKLLDTLSEINNIFDKETNIDIILNNPNFKNYISNIYNELWSKYRNFNIGFEEKEEWDLSFKMIIRRVMLNILSNFSMIEHINFKDIMNQWMNGNSSWNEHKENQGNYQTANWVGENEEKEADAFTTSGSTDQTKTKFGSEMFIIRQNWDSKIIMSNNKIIYEFDSLFVYNYNIIRKER